MASSKCFRSTFLIASRHRFSGRCFGVPILALLACFGLTGCGGSPGSTNHAPGYGSAPTITSFAANPASISSGASITLTWATNGATTISISPANSIPRQQVAQRA